MGIMNKMIIAFIFIFLKINCADNTRVINTCGNLGYKQPEKAEDCVEDKQICCYASLEYKENEETKNIKFCVSSPSDIEKDDVKDEILQYTKFTILDLKCNKSQYIYNSMMILSLFIFILF